MTELQWKRFYRWHILLLKVGVDFWLSITVLIIKKKHCLCETVSQLVRSTFLKLWVSNWVGDGDGAYPPPLHICKNKHTSPVICRCWKWNTKSFMGYPLPFSICFRLWWVMKYIANLVKITSGWNSVVETGSEHIITLNTYKDMYTLTVSPVWVCWI